MLMQQTISLINYIGGQRVFCTEDGQIDSLVLIYTHNYGTGMWLLGGSVEKKRVMKRGERPRKFKEDRLCCSMALEQCFQSIVMNPRVSKAP